MKVYSHNQVDQIYNRWLPLKHLKDTHPHLGPLHGCSNCSKTVLTSKTCKNRRSSMGFLSKNFSVSDARLPTFYDSDLVALISPSPIFFLLRFNILIEVPRIDFIYSNMYFWLNVLFNLILFMSILGCLQTVIYETQRNISII